MVQEQVRGNIVHIVVVLNVRLGIEWNEQMEASTEQESEVDTDENEEDFVYHCCGL